MKILFEMGTNGSVSGDSFVKVAYEEPWADSIGREHPGRVRLLPLNSAYCMPEWHPHDRSRMIRCKIKYRFYGCVDDQTQALTREGWKSYTDLSTEDELLTLDPETDEIRWQPVEAVHIYPHEGYLTKWSGKIDALTTDNHRWLAQTTQGERFVARSSRREGLDPAVPDLYREDKIIVGGGTPLAFAESPTWNDEFVETVAWYICDASDHVNQQGYHSVHLSGSKDHKVAAWRRLAAWWTDRGATFRESDKPKTSKTDPRMKAQRQFYLGKGVVESLQEVAPRKQVDPEFLSNLTYAQAELFYSTLIAADGHVRRNSVRWGQVDQGRVDMFQMLAAMLGKRSRKPLSDPQVQVYADRYVNARTITDNATDLEPYAGEIWCPTVESGIWFARRNGSTYWTGNTSPQGTRSVYCVDDQTEALTRSGWKKHTDLSDSDEVLAIDPSTKEVRWEPVLSVHRFDWDGPLTRWKSSQMDALTTPNHRWVVENWRDRDPKYAIEGGHPGVFKTTEKITTDGRGSDRLVLSGGTTIHWPVEKTYSDEMVELVAWTISEGHYKPRGHGVMISQSETHNFEYCERIRLLAKHFRTEGHTVSEYPLQGADAGKTQWYFGKGIGIQVRELAPNKQITPEFLAALTREQAELFYDTCIDGDGHRRVDTGLETWLQQDQGRLDGFQMLVAMLGQRTAVHPHGDGCASVSVYRHERVSANSLTSTEEHYEGIVWCPKTPSMTWLARRGGTTYFTGNTYVELLTDEVIEEYVNDELIDSRPNPIGMIPIVHIPNMPVPSSPWGLSDCQDIINLNMHYNEVSTDIADIVNYHCVDEETEILTIDGWKRHDQLDDIDVILALNPDTKEMEWQPATFNRFDFDGELVRWDNRIDALTTPGHRWMAERRIGRDRRYVSEIVRTSEAQDGDASVAELTQGSRLVVGGGIPAAFAHEQKWSDELVETVGWYITEGADAFSGPRMDHHAVSISQSEVTNPHHVETIRRLAAYWRSEGGTFTEAAPRPNGVITWYVGKGVTSALREAAPEKQLTPEFIRSLTYHQAKLLHQTLIDGDGTDGTGAGRSGHHVMFYQKDEARTDGFQMLCSMLGIRTNRMTVTRDGTYSIREYQKNHILAEETVRRAELVRYTGTVWCPTVESSIWMARRNGVTYWTGNSAPVTVIVGAKASQLEKGAKKVWGGLPKEAQVFNLEGGASGLEGALKYLETVKRSMHELVGVPETVLGQMQPISNTSGVALSIQFQPLMNRWTQKVAQYGEGMQRINELILLTLAVKEPQALVWDENSDVPLGDDQLAQLDPSDPLTYITTVHFPPPLPLDKLVLLNEIQMLMQLNLESREGALRVLGEEFPEEKLAEIRDELVADTIADGALNMLKAQVTKEIMDLTGMMPGMDGAPATPLDPGMMTADGDVMGDGAIGPEGMATPDQSGMDVISGQANLRAALVTKAYGTKLAVNRKPDDTKNDR